MEIDKQMEINYVPDRITELVDEQNDIYNTLSHKLNDEDMKLVIRLLDLEHILTKETDV